jgi:hypothetical protein
MYHKIHRQDELRSAKSKRIFMAMPGDSFLAFMKVITRDPSLCHRLKRAPDLDTFLSEVTQVGYSLSRRELQLWANHEIFDQDGWPWAGKSQDSRMAFFRGESMES